MGNKELAQKLVSVEVSLNMIEIEGCKVGSILSKFHENLYHGKTRRLNIIGFIMLLLKRWLKSFNMSKPTSGIINSKLLLSKITDKPQCNALIDPIKENYGSGAVLYTSGCNNELKPYSFPMKIPLLRVFKILGAVYSHKSKIKKAYHSQDLSPNWLNLTYTLFIQLNAFINWSQLFNLSKPSLIVVDFDRDNRNAPLLLAARNKGITSVTLVHGVINPPFGYWPVIADEIWCWSNYQSAQLIHQGVEKKRIRIVGCPIAKRIIDPTIKKHKKAKMTIGIGMNPIGKKRNRHLLLHFLNAEVFGQFSWLVKLHPSMKKSKWMTEIEIEIENLTIKESSVISIKDFFSTIDLLVVGNSGIGYEAVVNEIPVWVYRADLKSIGHDRVMIENGNCPDITDPESLRQHLLNLISNEEYLNSILEKEKSFVYDEFYACTGEMASKTIIKYIEEELSHAV